MRSILVAGLTSFALAMPGGAVAKPTQTCIPGPCEIWGLVFCTVVPYSMLCHGIYAGVHEGAPGTGDFEMDFTMSADSLCLTRSATGTFLIDGSAVDTFNLTVVGTTGVVTTTRGGEGVLELVPTSAPTGGGLCGTSLAITGSVVIP